MEEEDEGPAELLTKPREYQVKFSFPDPPPLNPPILGAYGQSHTHATYVCTHTYALTHMHTADVKFGYSGQPLLFKELNFGISMESRGR